MQAPPILADARKVDHFSSANDDFKADAGAKAVVDAADADADTKAAVGKAKVEFVEKEELDAELDAEGEAEPEAEPEPEADAEILKGDDVCEDAGSGADADEDADVSEGAGDDGPARTSPSSPGGGMSALLLACKA